MLEDGIERSAVDAQLSIVLLHLGFTLAPLRVRSRGGVRETTGDSHDEIELRLVEPDSFHEEDAQTSVELVLVARFLHPGNHPVHGAGNALELFLAELASRLVLLEIRDASLDEAFEGGALRLALHRRCDALREPDDQLELLVSEPELEDEPVAHVRIELEVLALLVHQIRKLAHPVEHLLERLVAQVLGELVLLQVCLHALERVGLLSGPRRG